MNCPKCTGLMITERMTDFSMVFYGWRCVNCGTIMDSTIVKNRKGTGTLSSKSNSVKLRKAV